MRLGWRVAVWICLPSLAAAEPAPSEYHAMPGGVHVATAATVPAGTTVIELSSGVGYRSGLLAEDHHFVRAMGEVAAAFGVLDTLTVSLAFQGYRDRHYGFPSGTLSGCGATCETGLVGAPHLFARFAKPAGAAAFGAQLDVWVPGDVVPSMKLGATSFELRGLASLPIGRATATVNAGFHFDNSANTITDISRLSVPDRVSFGVSNYNAFVAGARASHPFGSRMWLAAESSFVAFVGAAPTGMAALLEDRWLLRGAISAGIEVAPDWTVVAFVEGIKGPGVLASQAMASEIPIISYEPMIIGGCAIASRFGGNGPRAPAPAPPCWETPAGCATEDQPLYTDVSGTVLNEDGMPLPGVTVTVTGNAGASGSSTTTQDGAYTIEHIRIGRRSITPSKAGAKTQDRLNETGLEVRVELAGREPAVMTIDSPKLGGNRLAPIALPMKLPPGEVKGVVRDLRGKPIADATVVITPGAHKVETRKDGTFAIELAPGTYKVKVHARGFGDQEVGLTIDPNGVALKEFVLRE